jgi:DNA-binding beta-propeller fold protein YncE
MLRKAILLLVSLAPAFSLSLAQERPSFHLEREIALPGVEGRIDHMSADVAGHRVFVAALGNGTVEVVDLAQGQRTAQIKGLKDPQGVVYVPSNGAVYVASGGDGTVKSFDSHTLQPLHTASLGADADNLRYDAGRGQLLAGYGSGAIAVLGLDLARLGNFELPAHPESFQLSADGSRIFVNLPDSRSVAAIDLATKSVNPTWAHPSASANFPMAVDGRIQRLFIPCRQPSRLLVVNSETGGITSWAPSVKDADDVFVDEARRFVYVIGGDGYIDVVFVRAADALVSRAHVPTGPGARTGLYVPEWNQLLVAAPSHDGKEARILVFSTLP